MPSHSSNPSGSSSGSAYTGGHGHSSGAALGSWATTADPFERFGVTGQTTGRGYIQQAGNMADWEQRFQQAGRR
ncbi:Fc.00g008350.m01.CDS01 [Cosmosporella sp. VM-42]